MVQHVPNGFLPWLAVYPVMPVLKRFPATIANYSLDDTEVPVICGWHDDPNRYVNWKVMVAKTATSPP